MTAERCCRSPVGGGAGLAGARQSPPVPAGAFALAVWRTGAFPASPEKKRRAPHRLGPCIPVRRSCGRGAAQSKGRARLPCCPARAGEGACRADRIEKQRPGAPPVREKARCLVSFLPVLSAWQDPALRPRREGRWGRGRYAPASLLLRPCGRGHIASEPVLSGKPGACAGRGWECHLMIPSDDSPALRARGRAGRGCVPVRCPCSPPIAVSLGGGAAKSRGRLRCLSFSGGVAQPAPDGRPPNGPGCGCRKGRRAHGRPMCDCRGEHGAGGVTVPAVDFLFRPAGDAVR